MLVVFVRSQHCVTGPKIHIVCITRFEKPLNILFSISNTFTTPVRIQKGCLEKSSKRKEKTFKIIKISVKSKKIDVIKNYKF